jgi:hypothetical protein
MPTGPKGENRLADVIGNPVKVMRISTGEEVEKLPNKSTIAAFLGGRGAKSALNACLQNVELRLPKRARNLDVELALFPLEKASLRGIVNHPSLYSTDNNVRLHHRVRKSEGLLPIAAAFN